jgi:hypothetical protein
MSVKLIQYWNIMHGKKADFDAFFNERFVPGIDALGHMKMTASWLVASGEGPYFVAEGVSDSADAMAALAMDPGFVALRNDLLGLVKDYNTKLLFPTGRVAQQPVKVQEGYKFNRHFNINAADYYACDAFLAQEYFPMMADFGLRMVGDWHVGIGGTPYAISESGTDDLSRISLMLQSPENQDLTLKLLSMVTAYGCKILIPSGHINKIQL